MNVDIEGLYNFNLYKFEKNVWTMIWIEIS